MEYPQKYGQNMVLTYLHFRIRKLPLMKYFLDQLTMEHMLVSMTGGTPKWLIYNGKPSFIMEMTIKSTLLPPIPTIFPWFPTCPRIQVVYQSFLGQLWASEAHREAQGAPQVVAEVAGRFLLKLGNGWRITWRNLED